MAAASAGARLHAAFRRDLDASRARVATGNRITETSRGPIEYAEAGTGAPVLAVHGSGGGFDQGMILFGALARRGARVIAMSRFGYLRTPLPADASPAAQADAYAALLDALGIERAAIIGGSAGAPSAMQFAIRHPARCTALVLVVPLAWKPADAAVPPPSPLAEEVLRILVGSDLAFWLACRFARDAVIRKVLATPPEQVHAAAPAEQARVGAIIDGILPVSQRARGLVNEARIVRTLARYALERIMAPTLVISARDDLYGLYASARYTAERIAGARFIGYDTGGHLCVGHTGQSLDEIAGFLGLQAERSGASPASG